MPTEAPEVEIEIGELDVSEYIVLLLAWDTYYRYLKESTNTPHPVDDHTKAGVSLIRRAELQSGEQFKAFLDEHLPSESHKRMLAKAFRFTLTRDGLPRKALQIRTLLSRGGASTMRKVFKTNKALQQVRTAMSAAMVDDADQALDKFAVISLRNMRIRTWISKAAELAGPGSFQSPVDGAQQTTVDDTDKILSARIEQASSSPTSQTTADAGAKHEELLAKVQLDAQDAAEQALKVMGETDEPPKKSEVVGIATAAAVAAVTDPKRLVNVPVPLQRLDPEQLVAAMAMGRVVVAAGAGSGKTSTLTSRIAYLVNDLKVSPNRIFACVFNKKASTDMKETLASKVGQQAVDQMSVGTMHSLFKRFVVEFGNPEEKATLTTWLMPTSGDRDKQSLPSKAPTLGAMSGYMGRIWKECFGEDPPGKSTNVIQSWMMNNITPEMAKSQATTPEETQQAVWYEWFLGFKGTTKNWSPPCAREPRAGKQWGEYLAKWRDNGKARLGDFNDMLLIMRDILKRDVNVRKKIQGMYDHIAVDEAQDLNEVQHEIVAYMSEHVPPDPSSKKSVFYVGDEIQCINSYVGARPELFSNLTKRPDFKTYKITTNYRCLPEIIEAANVLMTHHPRQIEMEARPDSSKPRGAASLVVQSPSDHAAGAVQTISQIKQDLDAGADITDYAVLTRTNMEQNDYETACIIAGIPYGRRGGTSFLKSPETVTVMCYFNLVAGQDFERMQKSLAEVLDKPRRFFLARGQAEQVIQSAVRKLAQRKGVSTSAINPLELLDEPRLLVDAMDPQRRWPDWRVRQALELTENMGYELHGMRDMIEKGETVDIDTGEKKPYTTQSLIGDILAVRGKAEKFGEPEPTLRDTLMPAVSIQEEETDAPESDDDDPSKKPIGNVAFLFQIAQSDNSDLDPSNPINFKAKIDKLAADAKDLRVDINSWNVAQSKLPPSERKAPPCVVLSTVHSCKGAQWSNTTVVMAAGVFPMAPRKRKDEDMLSDEARAQLEAQREEELLTERQLAYVAMTRAAKQLTVVCPDKSVYGKAAGISKFVTEAGLHVGQNVEGKNDPTPAVEPTGIKTAATSIWSMLRSAEETPNEGPDSVEEVLAYGRNS